MKKNLLVFAIFFMCNIVYIKAQWYSYTYLSTQIGNPWDPHGILVDVDFTSEGKGMYCYDHFYSNSVGTIIEVKSTIDSCATWNSVWSNLQMGTYSYALYSVKNQNTLYHIRNWQGNVQIDKTINNGLTWTNSFLEHSGFYRNFSAIDNSHLFLLYTDFMGGCFIDKYVNGTFSSKIDSFSNINPFLMYFPDTSTGYIAAISGKKNFIYKSSTGGTGWVKIFSDTLMSFNKMFFTSANVGYVVGKSGKIIKSANGGLNWLDLNTQTTINLNSVFFLNDSVGYVAGDSGLIIKTIDGGIKWHKQTTGTTGGFRKIFFVNDSVGFALSGQMLYKTKQDFLMSVDENSFRINFNFSPNPTNGIITINNDSERMIAFKIINLLGEIIYSSQGSSKNIQIDLSSQPDGIYFINTKTEKGSVSKKIILAR